MTFSRYSAWSKILLNFLNSKFLLSHDDVIKSLIENTNIAAGLYRPNEVFIEYGLMLANLTSAPFTTRYEVHGKRQRRTLSFRSKLRGDNSFLFINKFINEVILKFFDFKTLWSRRELNFNQMSYTFHIAKMFSQIVDIDDLVENKMYDKHRSIFLPLMVSIVFSRPTYYLWNETILRMLSFPIIFYKRRVRASADDKYQIKQVGWMRPEDKLWFNRKALKKKWKDSKKKRRPLVLKKKKSYFIKPPAEVKK